MANEIIKRIVYSFQINEKAVSFFLAPAHYNSRKTEAKTLSWWLEVEKQAGNNPFKIFGHDYRYTSADLDHFTKLFRDLSQQTTSFFMEYFMAATQERLARVRDSQKSSVQLGVKPAEKHQKSE